MKSIINLSVLLCLFTVIACDDDEKQKGEVHDIKGVWVLSRLIVEECADSELNKIENCTANCPEIVITENQILQDDEPVFQYKINKDILYMERIADDEIVEARFILTDKTLILLVFNEGGGACAKTAIYRRK